MVNDDTLNAIVTAFIINRISENNFSFYHNGEKYTFKTYEEIGQTLKDEMIKSLNSRYPKANYKSDSYRHHPKYVHDGGRITPIVIIKLCHFYEYQTCESPTWKNSLAHSIISITIRESISKIPGYSDAPWGF